jgi:hypothetical protein
MGRVLDGIDAGLREFIDAQHMFFVATAPLYEFQRERSQLGDWANRKGPDAIQDYQVEKNARSIDGLPAVTWIAGGGNSGRTS